MVYLESLRPLRRVQIDASFNTRELERERGLFV
jgi:hypothetical protein